MEREEIIKNIKEIVSKNNIRKAYLFGSFARKEKYNDIDIAIEPPKRFSLLDFSRVANLLEDRLGIHVDLISTRSIHPKLKSIIEKEMIAL